MDDDEWTRTVAELAAAQVAPTGDEHGFVRAALARAYALLAYGPERVSGEYCRIPEAELAAAATFAHAALDGGDWSWTPPSDLAGAARSTAARVRALDRLLKQASAHHGPPVDIEEEYLCPTTGWFVIPRLTARVPRPGHGGRSFLQQRGTLDHRLLPRRFGSYTVRLHWLADVGAIRPDAPLGAAMFEDFRIELARSEDPKEFHATGITCPGATEAIADAVSRANAEGCTCLAWPELTMRPEVEQTALRSALEDLAASAVPGSHPAFTLAGSWHVGDDPRRNVAPVLDFSGDTILEHVKARPYADNDYGEEAIFPDYTIPVLVTQHDLVAFAICKDFCDFRDNPYPTLNVDLVVVGSLDGPVTMDSHRTIAAQAAANGTSSFVVQQDLETGRGDTGWVLRPAQSAEPVELATLRRGRWSVE